MTSINAIRFNHYQGACICDESISYDDSFVLNVSDKIQNCIPAEITEKYGFVGVLGTTGSCSVGDELKKTLQRNILKLYREEIKKNGLAPDKWLNVNTFASMAYDIIVSMKNDALSRRFKSEYGLSTWEFTHGSYQKEGKEIEIKDKETIRRLVSLMTWKEQQPEASFIFNNAALFAGYDDETGFAIFHYDLRGGYWHKVQNCYLAEGSGRHSVDPAMYSFAENLLLENRRGEIDPVQGTMALIHGLNKAIDHEIGVGGYPNIILIDGKQTDYHKRMREIADKRALLASQIMRSLERSYLKYQDAYECIDGLLYHDASFDDIYQQMFAKSSNSKGLRHWLSGYKILPYQQEI